jgi:hypothetical protein
MERFCENSLCENEAVRMVPVSVNTPSDQKRSLCAAYKEAYDWGVQHGRMTPGRKKIWVLAVADRGTVVHGRAFRRRSKAVQGLAEYLTAHDGYTGPAEMPSICDWLAEHDERLSIEIFPASLDLSPQETVEPTLGKRMAPSQGFTIEPPPKEKGPEPLYRVVYVIDVNAPNPQQAAERVYEIMQDPQSMRPVLEVLEPLGRCTRVDLSQE